MKKTSCNKWIHDVCVLYIPELYFAGDVAQVSKLSKKRSRLLCVLCNLKGGCVQCSKNSCVKSYHPYCALNAGHYMTILENGKSISYCKTHTIIKQNELLEKQFSNLNLVQFEIGRFIDELTRRQLVENIKKKIPKVTFTKIIEYWKRKRMKHHNGRFPLIRRLQIEAESEVLNQFTSPKLLIKNYTEEEKYIIMKEIRVQLEKYRMITDLIITREKKKHQMVKNLISSIEEIKNSQGQLTLKLRLPKKLHEKFKKSILMFLTKI